jgi:hypothetical protein
VIFCIWCKQPSNKIAKEHIIPEALGCPNGFWLQNGEVCESCNNNLGYLDQAVINEFDLLTFHYGIPRKKNNKPAVLCRGNLVAKFIRNGPMLFINMDRESQFIDGNLIGGFGKSKRNIKANIDNKDNIFRLTFSTTIGDSRKFIRGILKIALSSLTYFIGYKEVLSTKYDKIREFVKNDKGDRVIFMGKSNDLEYRHQVWPPYKFEDNFVVIFRLGIVEFFVDLSPEMTLSPIIYNNAKEIYGNQGWTVLPTSFKL